MTAPQTAQLLQPLPPDVPASELFRRLCELPRPHTLFRYPRKDPKTGEPVGIEVALVVLTEAELQSARAAAELYAQDLLGGNPHKLPISPAIVETEDGRSFKRGSVGYEEVYRNECIVEVLCRAVRVPGKLHELFFPNPQLARRYTTSDEFAALFEAYCRWQVESGPLVSSMDKDTMDAWLRKLEEGGSAVPLALVSSEAQTALLMHSVSELRRLRTASGSSGTPAGGSPSVSEASPSEQPSRFAPAAEERPPRE